MENLIASKVQPIFFKEYKSNLSYNCGYAALIETAAGAADRCASSHKAKAVIRYSKCHMVPL